MKCKIPNQDAGTSHLYIGEAMEEHYDPPGREVQTDEQGVKFIDVEEDCGEILVANYDFEEYEHNSTYDYSK